MKRLLLFLPLIGTVGIIKFNLPKPPTINREKIIMSEGNVPNTGESQTTGEAGVSVPVTTNEPTSPAPQLDTIPTTNDTQIVPDIITTDNIPADTSPTATPTETAAPTNEPPGESDGPATSASGTVTTKAE